MKAKAINRAALIIKPKQPYIDWANHFNDGGPTLTIQTASLEPDVFLIDDLENEQDKQKIIRKYYKTIFQHELDAWMTDRDSWPSSLDLRTFILWFDVDVCDIVFDLAPDPLVHEQF